MSVTVNVDEWLNSANAESLAPEEEESSQRSSSSMSIKTGSESSGGQRVSLYTSFLCFMRG